MTYAVILFVLISQKPQFQNNKTSVCMSVVDVISSGVKFHASLIPHAHPTASEQQQTRYFVQTESKVDLFKCRREVSSSQTLDGLRAEIMRKSNA